jgi:branched-chain amino acid transport system permease protein
MLLSTLVVGIVLGGTYALLALGLTIQYGVARIMNLAYGEIVIAGAFFTLLMVSAAGLSPLLGLLLVVPLGYVLSHVL